MKQTIGRFLLQPNKNFPVDCETLEALQTNIALLQVLGNLAGDKAVLLGCEPEQNGTRRKAGYVFLKTKDFPEGEVIYWEGGTVSGGMYVHQEIVPVTAQGYEFPQAYTVRSLKAGVGAENYRWTDFSDAATIPALQSEIESLREAIAKMRGTPLGIVEMWSGKKIPDDYVLCDGAALRNFTRHSVRRSMRRRITAGFATRRKAGSSAFPTCAAVSSSATTVSMTNTSNTAKRVVRSSTP